jgi:uncharacterized protein
MVKIATTIPQLDKMLGGGIDQGSVTAVWMEPGTNGAPFVYQMAAEVSKKSKLFYFVNSKSPEIVKREAKEYGFALGKVNFVDSYSALVGAKTSSALLVANPKDPEEILNEVSIITKKIKNAVIVLDSLSNFIDLVEQENVKFLKAFKESGATIICLFTEWGYDPSFVKKIRLLIDNIIEVKLVRDRLFSRTFFGVAKAGGKKLKSKGVPFRLEKSGGIKIFIPKVLVTGPFNAGKTSLIHSASQKAVSVDRLGTTIALDHGHLKYGDFSVDLFGTPGQQRFDPILKLLGGEALGVIVVVSSTDPQGFPRALDMIEKAKVSGLPIVIGANKANLRGALKPDQIQKRLGLKDVQVIPLVAKDLTKVQPGLPCQLNEKDIKKLLSVLFSELMEGK